MHFFFTISCWSSRCIRSVCVPYLPPMKLEFLKPIYCCRELMERTCSRPQNHDWGCAPRAAETPCRLQARDLGRSAAVTPEAANPRFEASSWCGLDSVEAAASSWCGLSSQRGGGSSCRGDSVEAASSCRCDNSVEEVLAAWASAF